MPPRKGKQTAPEPQKVASPDKMNAQAFRLHCQTRHRFLGFWAKGEHAADHRLHQDNLDHTHAVPTEENTGREGDQIAQAQEG